MSITDNAKAYHEKMFPGQQSALAQTDPEFIERFDNFAFDEVVNQGDLDDRTRMMAILATSLDAPPSWAARASTNSRSCCRPRSISASPRWR